ncbi:MAG TPA: xanthine dehydrogenase family protein molybdopterin-binding subunit [Dehalococcoidia bacterium]|nr:xanthine dehydrogenase family protein molybdopterin-binding subunit [Dehalococcoidia bacterium]
MVATREYKVVGTRPIRPDGADKVTGRAEYGVDTRLPGMLYGRVKRSPHAHAMIKKIDASRALALPGVKAVITAADFPEPQVVDGPVGEGPAPNPMHYQLAAIMANKKALYVGHPIAAVCATDPHIAEDALDLIEIDYEVLPFVQDVREAMAKGAPILLDDLRTRAPEPLKQSLNLTDGPTNIASVTRFERGDIAAGFKEADVVIEREFETSMFHQGYIEPHAGTAFWNKDGKLTVWSSSQGHFMVRASCSALLHIPVSQINAVPMEIGGGFGGKTIVYLEPLAALLSKKTGKPVKLTMTRAEVLEATGPTSGTYMRVKIGAKKDGTITAAQVHLAFEAGAFPGSPVGAGGLCALGPYSLTNSQVDCFDVVLNKPKVAAYRAPGAPASEFGVETVINEIAKQLDIDPIELRLKNAAREGMPGPFGAPHGPVGAIEVLEQMRNHPHYRSELQGENQGRGIAMGFWFNGGGPRSVSATLNPDGSVGLVSGNVDVGGLRSSMAIMLAETLGIAHDDIHPHIVPTDDIGDTGMSGGSSSAYSSGWAVFEVGQELKRKLTERAARIWEVDADTVEYGKDGVLRCVDGRSMTFKELCGRLNSTGGSISAANTTVRQGNAPAYAGHIVDVEVDKETGKVEILRYTAFQDAGTAIHPSYVEGQVQGGAVQGIGMALTEEYVWGKNGQMLNASLLDYRMPTALDLPMIETVLVEVPNPNHPYGVRGVGEVSIVPPMPAIQAAIAEAAGVHLYRAPMSSKVVLEALLDQQG